MLTVGSKGAEVLKLQRDLSACGFNPGPLDGIFGPLTAAAVKRLKVYCGLSATAGYNEDAQQALKLLLPHSAERGRRLSNHFSAQEFACRCCGMVRINIKLITMLEQLRAKLGGKPITITSGYRCPKHNIAVGGVKNSQHLLGNATDIVVAGVTSRQVTAAAKEVGFAGVGLYTTFTHVDVRSGSNARWSG